MSLRHFAGTLYLIGAAFLTVNYAASLAALRRAASAWMCGAAVTSLAAIVGAILFLGGMRDRTANVFLSFYGSLPTGPYPRVMAMFLDPNMLCTYTVASAMILVAAREARWLGRGLFHILVTSTAVATAFSLSPGIGGLFLAISLWWAGLVRTRWLRLGRLLLILGALSAVTFFSIVTIEPASILAAVASGQFFEHLVPSSRVLTWRDAWDTFLMHPLVGKGLGLEVAAVQGAALYTDAHNVWLSVLAQSGVLGAVAFMCVALPLLRGFRLPRPNDDAPSFVRVGVQLAFIGGFLYPSLSGSFEDTRHVWVLMGLAAAASMADERLKPS